MFKQAILAAGLVLLACTVGGTTIKAGAAAAQAAPAEKAPVYTYVSEWTVHARWADYKKEDEADVEAMKKAWPMDFDLIRDICSPEPSGGRADTWFRGFPLRRWQT